MGAHRQQRHRQGLALAGPGDPRWGDLDGALRAFLPDTKHRQWRIRCGWTVTSDDGELLNVFLPQAKSARSARAPETGSDDASL